MIIDADTIADDTRLRPDVCIVGSGPAGLTVADRLLDSGLDVAVLESGAHEPDARAQALAEGAVTGEPFRFNGLEVALEATQLRQLGGTSNHWTGMCRPLDAHDFEPRDAVPGSGWPFGRDELAPHYARAVTSCQLSVDEWAGAWWSQATGRALLVPDGAVRTEVAQFSPPTRFGPVLAPKLAAARRTHVYLGATAVEILTTPDGSRVQALRVVTPAGRRWSVEAGTVVLAAGGIATPRLLLASTGAAPAGVGNGFDVVGRYFMEHPHAIAGRVQLHPPAGDWSLYLIDEQPLADGRSQLAWAGLVVSPEDQAEAGIGNGCIFLWAGIGGPPRDGRDVDTVAATASARLARAAAPGPVSAVMSVRTEQVPNRDSRVTLGPERDELGMPRAAVHWQLTERDHRTLRRTIELVGAALGSAGVGRVEVDPSGRPIEDWPIGIGNHHMGTTRMHIDPAQGVVDPDSRVHGVDNLYICGSSVFPTSGMANPTLTIVALAHRLADHLLAGGLR